MNFKKNLPLIYVFIWALYNLQGLFGGYSSLVGLLSLMFGLTIGLFFVMYVNGHYTMTMYMKGVNVLVLMLTLYAIFYIIGDEVYYGNALLEYRAIKKTNTIKYVYMNFFPLYVYFWSARENIIDERWLKKFLYLWFVIAIVMYIDYQMNALQSYMERGINVDDVTNNMGSEFLDLIPLLLLVPISQKKKMLFLVIFSIFAFSSFKRGTIMICALYILFFIIYTLKSTSRNKKLPVFIGILLAMGTFVYYISNLFNNSVYMQARWENTLEGNTSGRDDIFIVLWNHYQNNTSILEQLFGLGTDATVGLAGNWAHNDWLEILTCQGAMGVCVFVYYFWGLFKDRRRCLNPDIKTVLTMILIMFILKSIFSMSYPGLTTTVILGFCLANLNKVNLIKDEH